MGWKVLACAMNRLISCLSTFLCEKASSMKRFHVVGLTFLGLRFVSISALKMLAKDTAIFVPWLFREVRSRFYR